MPARSDFKKFLTFSIAVVWLVNGLYCKVLTGVPRHQLIVTRILGEPHAGLLTRLIGWSEVLMALWVVSRLWPRWGALVQIGLVVTMNAIEFFLAPDLLLFGRFNAVFAALFAGVVYWSEFVAPKSLPQPTR